MPLNRILRVAERPSLLIGVTPPPAQDGRPAVSYGRRCSGKDARKRLEKRGAVVKEGKRWRVVKLEPGAGTGPPGRGVGWAGE